ncbi:HetP family heterocyst commitment protein [Pleurocapsa sp. CCALA 161]|uniref:HetP family heterocyst commitment protein n=1 Tax=Pleurocapsa sp. CCALA 161 TaxID=2107688 RepID=UPI001E540292
MTNEQFNQVVDAILSGKYSWACLLILRFSGYNPLHYIPYRTYNRLMKSNREPIQISQHTAKVSHLSEAKNNQKSAQIKDLDLYCLEDVEHQSNKVKGGQKSLPMRILSRLFVA